MNKKLLAPISSLQLYDQNDYLYKMSTNINISGEGVFATKPFKKEDFLLEYKGDLIKRVKHAR